MNGIKMITVIACLLIVGLIQLPETATAGTFTMRQCSGANHQDFNGNLGLLNGSELVDAISGCSTPGASKIGLYQDRSGPRLASGAGAEFLWKAPWGTKVIATQFLARLKDANGIRAELIAWDGSDITNLDQGVGHQGELRVSRWSDRSRPQSLVVAKLVCSGSSSCENQPSSVKAYLEVTDVEFTVEDVADPILSVSGPLWAWAGDGAHHRGSGAISVDGLDQGSGIAAAWVVINGLRVNLRDPVCPGDQGEYSTRFTPCPSSYTGSKSFDTSSAPFQPGANQIQVCVRDYADSEENARTACTGKRTLLLDNERPRPAIDLRSIEGPEWQPSNGFSLRWGVPGGQISPVVGAALELRDLETGASVGAEYFETGDVSSGFVEVPAVGAYRAIVYLVDEALNIGEPAETILRFDDRPPGDIQPSPASGWVSRDELPLQQEVERAEPGGPSGISGYAMTVSDNGPEMPCQSQICLDPEVTLSGGADLRVGSVGGLGEGSHWVSAVAVSGAGKASLEPGSTIVNVDRTPPETSISGVPNEWVNHPVSVTAQARDPLSGMAPEASDDGTPRTVIAAENYAPYAVTGPSATFTVATEGVNRIRYWAEDLAGNANDGLPGPEGDPHPTPGLAVVRIDTTPPRANFEPTRDPQDPEIVRLAVDDADSGVASVAVGIRRAGSKAGFTPLQSSGKNGLYTARIRSDELDAAPTSSVPPFAIAPETRRPAAPPPTGSR